MHGQISHRIVPAGQDLRIWLAGPDLTDLAGWARCCVRSGPTWCTTGRWTDLSSQLQRCHRGGAVGVPLEIRRDGGAGAETRGHDLFLVAVDDGVQSMRRPQLKAAATEDDGTLPTLALVVDWLQIK